jgi:hypothetical protein
MQSKPKPAGEQAVPSGSVEGLQQALLRLTSQPVHSLEGQVGEVRTQIEALRASLEALEDRLNRPDGDLQGQDASMEALIRSLRQDLDCFSAALAEPVQVADRVRPVLVDLVRDRVQQENEDFADAVSPVIGPAIRHQIREAREDIIDALYPVIGQIITRSIAEAIRELARNIDHRMRRGLDFKSRWAAVSARFRGVSQSELILRESFDFNVNHVFLIQRYSGLLMEHLSPSDWSSSEFGAISGMLTAIRDFVSDSFGQGQGDLEEISYGNNRILLASGHQAFTAVVIDGVEPPGYAALMDRVTAQINLAHENFFRNFDGNMDSVPDLRPELNRLMEISPEDFEIEDSPGLSAVQKRTLWAVALAGLLLLALASFSCVFVIRLWPFAFG